MADPPAPENVRFEFDASREHVTLELGGGRLTLDAVELERLAQHLGQLRASMKPDVAPDPPPDSCPSVDAPRIAVQTTPDGRRAAFGVRTPMFGWLVIMLDRTQVEGLGNHFNAIAPTMAPRGN